MKFEEVDFSSTKAVTEAVTNFCWEVIKAYFKLVPLKEIFVHFML